MTTLRIAALASLLALLFLLWQQHRQIGLQADVIALQKSVQQQLEAGLQTLADSSSKNQDRMRNLLAAQQQVQQDLATRNAQFRRLQADVEEVRDWARQPLPADVVRLLEQPAQTGARHPGAGLPAGDPVHAHGGQPADQRGPAAAD